MFRRVFLLIFATFVQKNAHAYVLDLSDSTLWDAGAGSAYWDSENSKWTPPLETAVSSTPLQVGSGANGDFLNGPEQTGIRFESGAWVIDTDVKSEFFFSSFALQGATLRVVGRNPLTLRILKTFTVDATSVIELDGDAGSTPVAGSGARDGGSGGLQVSSTAAASGESGTNAGSGGQGGSSDTSAGGSNGGGGGCLISGSATSGTGGGTGAAGSCPSNGATLASSLTNPRFLPIGGAGGGGGYLRDLISPHLYDGAGGGGAGRALSVVALGSVLIEGTIRSRGGAGGDNSPNGGLPNCGGAGGGGAGGTLWLLSANAISGTGTLNTTGGAGGGSASCGGLYEGGSGSRGVVRLDSNTLSFSGSITPVGTEDHSETLEYQTGAHTLRTRWIEFNDGLMAFADPVLTLEGTNGDGAVTVTAQNGDGTVVPFNRIQELSGSKRIRLEARWENITGPDPERVIGISFSDALARVDRFPLTGTWGCAAVGSPQSLSSTQALQAAIHAIYGVLVFGLLGLRPRRRKRSSSRLD